jgi:hypothetical protein
MLDRDLIEQLLDFTAASAMARQYQHAHLPISSNGALSRYM